MQWKLTSEAGLDRVRDGPGEGEDREAGVCRGQSRGRGRLLACPECRPPLLSGLLEVGQSSSLVLVPHAERPRFPGPLLIRSRCPVIAIYKNKLKMD